MITLTYTEIFPVSYKAPAFKVGAMVHSEDMALHKRYFLYLKEKKNPLAIVGVKAGAR